MGFGLAGGWSTNAVYIPIRESQVVNPSEMIAIGDAVLLTDSIGGGGPIRGWLGLTGFFGDLTPKIVGSILPGLPANDSAVQGMNSVMRDGGIWGSAMGISRACGQVAYSTQTVRTRGGVGITITSRIEWNLSPVRSAARVCFNVSPVFVR